MAPITLVALAIFVGAYVFIATEMVNKTVVALLGGAVFVMIGAIGQEEAFRVIDWNVIFLLVSMMVIVNITRTTGLFQYVAIKTAKAARGNPVKILILLSVVTGLFSAFLDNVTTILILTPVTILIAVELGISPVPFIMSEAVVSNMGGTMTLIGDPPNIMIGSAAGLDFLSFIVNLAPVIIVIVLLFCVVSFYRFRKKLVVSNERKARIMEFDESKSIEDRPLLFKCLVVLSVVILGFLLHGFLHMEASTIALFGASALLLLTGKRELDEYFREIEWGTIFFFIGLFILVGGLVELGVIGKIAKALLSITGGNIKVTTVFLVWASGILSSFIDNIPYVATMIPMIHEIGASVGAEAVTPLWWALSLGACLGGNGTLVGASANVVAAGIATKSGYRITFLEFTKYGALYTLISLAVSTVYLLIRYF
jgi:Na+/H+ antiporter NhaD/arsenite permease-like protein